MSETAGPLRTSVLAHPTRLGSAAFAFKRFAFQIRRSLIDRAAALPRLNSEMLSERASVAEARSPLWSDPRPEERRAQLGKVQNLRVAACALDGTIIEAGSVFSFWKQLGPPTKRRGFAPGRMLQQGCMMLSTGGGLCQLSNAIYDVALRAQCEILERHAHSRKVAYSAAARGRDATVAWNYVDLRFRPREGLVLRVHLTTDELVVRLERTAPTQAGTSGVAFERATDLSPTCGTCGRAECHRSETNIAIAHERTAYLVDEAWPEFTAHVARAAQPRDVLAIPLDGRRWHLRRYRWDSSGFGTHIDAPLAALWRSVAVRRAGRRNARVQPVQLQTAEVLAKQLARVLTPEVTRLVVAQSFLPFLWRDGHLGGRHFEVLMTRPPIEILERELDDAARRFPERATLRDFRAPLDITHWEREALAAADFVVTPHAQIAAMFEGRAILLSWIEPARRTQSRMPGPLRIGFPGPTVARKGAFEVRDAARMIGAEIVVFGEELEGAGFWRGVRVARPDPADPFAGVDVVVQPSLVENAPRRLLEALARGIPVVATPACGLAPREGLALIPHGDVAALCTAIRCAAGSVQSGSAPHSDGL